MKNETLLLTKLRCWMNEIWISLNKRIQLKGENEINVTSYARTKRSSALTSQAKPTQPKRNQHTKKGKNTNHRSSRISELIKSTKSNENEEGWTHARIRMTMTEQREIRLNKPNRTPGACVPPFIHPPPPPQPRPLHNGVGLFSIPIPMPMPFGQMKRSS